MTKAMAAESTSARAMTIRIVRWPLLALAAVAARAARFSASSSRASAERAVSRQLERRHDLGDVRVREALRSVVAAGVVHVSVRESATALWRRASRRRRAGEPGQVAP